MNMVVGLFHYYAKAEWALQVLECYDVGGERISIIALDKDTIKQKLTSVTGIVTGTLGTDLAGVLNGSRAFAFELSGVGPVLAIGNLAAKMVPYPGTNLAADCGGLLGILTDSGFSMEEAESYMEGVKQGGVLLFVETGLQDELKIKALLRGAGAVGMNICYPSWLSEDRVEDSR